MITSFQRSNHPKNAKLRVLIADDHPIVRSGIRNELTQCPDIEIVGEAVSGDEALQAAGTLQPDAVVLDINMPGLKATQVAQQLQMSGCQTRILVLTAYGDIDSILGMLEAGAVGYILKDDDPSAIAQGIRAVIRGETWLSPAVAQSLAEYATHRGRSSVTNPQNPVPPLSARELEVLRLLAQGQANKQIAEALQIAEGTIKNHIAAIYDKLMVKSRAEAVVWAWQHSIVDRH